MTNAFPATPESSDEAELSDRQRREIEYHRDRAAAHAHFATGRVDLSAVTSAHYRWWNAYWVILRKARRRAVGVSFLHRSTAIAKRGYRDHRSPARERSGRRPSQPSICRMKTLPEFHRANPPNRQRARNDEMS